MNKIKIAKLHLKIFTYGLIPVIFLLFSACQNEQEVRSNKYEKFLSQAHVNGQFNGNALIFENGEIAFSGSFGISNIDPIDSLNLNSIFRLGSVSKQFTAMGIMKLKEDGKLTYDQDIRDFIPELPYEGITIRHLLNHVSGLPDYTRLMAENWKVDLKFDEPERLIAGNIDIIKMLAKKNPAVHFKPLEKWEYSNTGYVLLASIVARASGTPFENYLQKQIFEPAKMSSTVVYNYSSGYDQQMPNRVYGFSVGLSGTDLISSDAHYLNPAQGDGGIYATLDDLLKWDRILYTNVLISEETKEEAFTPAILNNGDTTNYGFGWFIDKSPTDKKVVSHGGGWVGFRTYIYREIEENNCIVLLTNNSSRYLGSVLQPLKNILHNQSYEFPKLAIGETIGKVVMNKGAYAAIEQYKKLKSNKPDEYDFAEDQLNRLGYQLMQLDSISEAIEIFRLNKDEFPQSANTYDSFGDALLASGDTIQSLTNFKKALAMDSTFSATKEKIKNIEVNTMSNKK